MFVDACSGYVHVEPQVSTSSDNTIQSLTNFEQMAYNHGIIVKGYQSDNGTSFTSKEFRENLSTSKQSIQYAGASSHH